jgi:hypothetical protein
LKNIFGRTEALIRRIVPHDKSLHIIAGLLIFSVAHFISWQVGLATVIVAGLAKEGIDHLSGGDVSGWDVVATGVGGLLGLLCFAR